MNMRVRVCFDSSFSVVRHFPHFWSDSHRTALEDVSNNISDEKADISALLFCLFTERETKGTKTWRKQNEITSAVELRFH